MDASRQAGDGRKPKEPMQAGGTGGQERTLARSRSQPVREDSPTGRPRLQHADDDQPNTGTLAEAANAGIPAKRSDIVRFHNNRCA